jgi:WD40 domain-containing protein/WD40 repeat protein
MRAGSGSTIDRLAEVLAREGTLAAARVAQIIYQLAAQLDTARQAGRPYGGAELSLVEIESVPGRPDRAYMPDFLLRDPAEMTSGQRARKARRTLAVLAVQLLTGAPLDRSQPVWDQVLAHGLPPTTASVLIAALAEQADGFASFAEFAEALARSLGVPLGDRPAGGPAPSPGTARRKTMRLEAVRLGAARLGAVRAGARAGAVVAAIVVVVVGATTLGAIATRHHPAGLSHPPAPAGAPDWRGWPGAPAASALHPAPRVIVPGLYVLAVHDTVAVSPDGTRLIAVDSSGIAMAVNLVSGASSQLPSLSTGISPDGLGIAVAVSPDLATLAGAGSAGVETQSSGSGEPLNALTVSLGTRAGPSAFGFSPDGKTLAFGDGNGAIHLLNLASGRSAVLRSPDGAGLGGATALAFSPDSRELAVSTGTSAISLWNVARGTRITTLSDPAQDWLTGGVTTLAFGEKGALLAAGDGDGHVYLWDVARRRLLGALAGSPAQQTVTTFQVAFSPDGELVAASFADGTVGVRSAATGGRLALLPGGATFLTDPIAFGLGARVLVNVSSDGDLTRWRLR